MCFCARNAAGEELYSKIYYSVGGGFVVNKEAAEADRLKEDDTKLPYPFKSGNELLAICQEHGISISQVMMENEKVVHPVDISWNEAWTGTDQVRFFKLDGNILTITAAPNKSPIDGR